MENPALVPPLEILLVEDNPGDVRLTSIALKRSKMLINLNVVQDGKKALACPSGWPSRPNTLGSIQ